MSIINSYLPKESQAFFTNVFDSERFNAQASESNSDSISSEASQQALGGLLKRVEMMQGDLYTGRSWSRLMKTYSSAKAVSLKEPPDEQDLRRALRALMCDFMALQQAEKDDNSFREKLPLVLKETPTSELDISAVIANVGSVDISIDISV
jgi:hypothetical protein